jgi:predicted flap endonuclease-1-like 5' DNA nuclease
VKTIDKIEGIGRGYADKLKQAGVATVENLLDSAGDKSARKKLADKTGLSEKLLLKWTNMADLFRVNGIAGQYAELLERAGVDTVKELAQRNAATLHAKMNEVNEASKVVRRPPALKMVESWVQQAKTLPRMVSH